MSCCSSLMSADDDHVMVVVIIKWMAGFAMLPISHTLRYTDYNYAETSLTRNE